VLIADADEDTRAMYGTVLRLAGFEVIEAADGREALARALVDVPSAVLIEITLPLVDGFALCDILRRDPATRTVSIVAVTGESRPNQLKRIRAAGANAVLVKPTAPDVVVAEIRRLLDGASHSDESISADGASPPTAEPMHGANESEAFERLRRPKSHASFRFTTQLIDALALRCPLCDRALTYDHSYVGGVSADHAERWDYYQCDSCGAFQYRDRTRKLRRA
jgi:DNA-binding response OmpR family regulator